MIQPLKINGCFAFEPKVYSDSRGNFFEWFKSSSFETQSGESFNLAQANCSISKSGVIRGIHVAKNPPGQAKYVTCFSGSVFDVMVDLREESSTFGKWTSIEINSKNPTCVYIPSGVGHGFMSLENNTTFVYLCDYTYNPDNEFDLDPFDTSININWPKHLKYKLSKKDKNSLSFSEIIKKLKN